MRHFPSLRPFLLALPLIATGAIAQDTTVAFKGLRAGEGQPVEVTSDSLSVDQAGGTAQFTGHVLVVQGDVRLSSDLLDVAYQAADKTKIDTLTATGNVLLSTPTEAAKGQKAVYSLTGRTILMTGDVVLTQGQSVMSGQSLAIDLAKSTGTMNGRVRTVLQAPGKSTSAPAKN